MPIRRAALKVAATAAPAAPASSTPAKLPHGRIFNFSAGPAILPVEVRFEKSRGFKELGSPCWRAATLQLRDRLCRNLGRPGAGLTRRRTASHYAMQVLEEAQKDLVNYKGTGMSIVSATGRRSVMPQLDKCTAAV